MRITPQSIPAMWFEFDEWPVAIRCSVAGEVFTTLSPDPDQPDAAHDPARVEAETAAYLARNADYVAACRVLEGMGLADDQVSRQCVNGVVELSLMVLDPTPYREAVAAVIPESRVRIF